MATLFLFRSFCLVTQSRGQNIFNIDTINEMEINVINTPQSKFVSNEHSIYWKFKIFWLLIIGVPYSFSREVKMGEHLV